MNHIIGRTVTIVVARQPRRKKGDKAVATGSLATIPSERDDGETPVLSKQAYLYLSLSLSRDRERSVSTPIDEEMGRISRPTRVIYGGTGGEGCREEMMLIHGAEFRNNFGFSGFPSSS